MRLCWWVVLAAACEQVGGGTHSANPAEVALAAQVGGELAEASQHCERDRLRELIDRDRFGARTAERMTTKLRDSVHRTLADRDTVITILCSWQQRASSYRLLRVHDVDGEARPILRRITKLERTGVVGVAYDELALARDPDDGRTRIVDIYTYLQGEWLSELLGGEVDAIAAAGGVADTTEAVAALHHALELGRERKYGEALAAIDALPPTIRRSRMMQMVRVRFANGVSSELYQQALEDIAKLYPNDPSIALLEIDGAVMQHDYTMALHHIEAVEHAIGGDPFQDAIRAEVYLLRKQPGDLDRASDSAEAAVREEPTLAKGWWARLDVAVARGRWADAIKAVDQLHRRFGATLDETKMRESPALRGLAESAEFRAWRDSQP